MAPTFAAPHRPPIRGLGRCAAVLVLLVALSSATMSPSAAASPSDHRESRPIATVPNTLPRVPATGWTVDMFTLTDVQWMGAPAHLIARTNQPADGNPYVLRVYDLTIGAYVGTISPMGNSMLDLPSPPEPGDHWFVAVVSWDDPAFPPAEEQARSPLVRVSWNHGTVAMTSDVTTLEPGQEATLTPTASIDVHYANPFWTHDATSGQSVGVCSMGTRCHYEVTDTSPSTHRYFTYIGPTPTPTSDIATSAPVFITWAATGYRVSLQVTDHDFLSKTVTAFTNIDVGPTPYWIQLFDTRTGQQLTVCGWGTTCSAHISTVARSDIVAFISSRDPTLIPSNTQASSNVVSTGGLYPWLS